MHARNKSSGAQRFNCREYGHYRNDYPQHNDKKRRAHNGGKPQWKQNGGGGSNSTRRRGGRGDSRAGGGRGGGAKRCSLFNTAGLSGQEELQQKNNGNTSSAKFAKNYSPHQSE